MGATKSLRKLLSSSTVLLLLSPKILKLWRIKEGINIIDNNVGHFYEKIFLKKLQSS